MAGKIIDVTMQLIDKISQPLSGINSKLTDSGRQWQNAGKDISRTGESITKVGTALTTAVTLPLVGAGVGVVNLASTFEAGMSKVQAISGASGDSMELLNQKAMEMGAKTKFSATEAADAFSYMAMAGWKTEQMMSGIEGVMYLAGATGEDLAMTSDIVTDAMTAFGMAADGTSTVLKDGMELEVSNVTRFVDVLAATANNANTNVAMLGESFKYVAPVAGSLGYSVEDVSTALGVMANSGIKASQGGTALRTLLTNMSNPSKSMAAAMETLGVSLEDGEGNMLSFAQVLQDLRAGFGNLKMSQEDINAGMNYWNDLLESGQASEDEYNAGIQAIMENALGAEGAMKAQAAAMLAGKTGMAGLLALVNTSDDDFNALTESIKNSNGACEDMYNVTQNNLQGKLTVLKSTLESIGISLGNQLIPYVEKATAFIQGLADRFNSLDDSTKQTIVKFAAMAAAVGPAIMVFGKLTGPSGIGGLVTKIGSFALKVKSAGGILAALATPGNIVVIALLAIGAAIALVVTHWDQIKAAAQVAMNFIQTTVQTAVDAVRSKFEEFGVTFEFFKEKLQPIQEKLQELGNKFRELWTTYAEPAINSIKEAINGAWNFIQPILLMVAEVVKDVFEARIKFAIDAAVLTFKFLFEQITTIIDMILGIFNGLIDFVVGVFTGDWERAWNGVKEIFNSVVEGIQSLWENMINYIVGLIQNVIDKVSWLWDKLTGIGKKTSEEASAAGSVGGNAVGTSYWRGGTTWVHERGAEIIDLPKGSRIYPHSESLKMAYAEGARMGSGKGTANITISTHIDNVSVRNESDIDAIAASIANKLERTAQNLGFNEISYSY